MSSHTSVAEQASPVRSFRELQTMVMKTPPVVIAIAGAEDPEVLVSAAQARSCGLIKGAILVGDVDQIVAQLKALAIDDNGFRTEAASDPQQTARRAVASINRGEAEILVKGSVDSASYFKAILDKETGLRQSELLSNITLFEMPSYHKLLAVTDNAIVLQPSLSQKQAMIENTRPLFRALNITPAKVAAVAAVEKETLSMVATTDAASLRKMSDDGQMAGFIVDGPFGYDACICRDSAIKKGLGDSPVAGDPDLLLMPNLESANILGKAFKFHAQADSGGLLLGARVPVVLNSRSDSAERRFNSLLLAKLLAARPRMP